MACKTLLLLEGLAVALFLLSAAEVVSARFIVKPEAIDLDMSHVQDAVIDREAQEHEDNEFKKEVQNAEPSHDDALAAPSPDESPSSSNANLHIYGLGWLKDLLGLGSPGHANATGYSGVASGPTASDDGN